MTREEAIDIIKCLAWYTRPNEEDVEQAIKALQQEPCIPTRDLSDKELKHFAEEMKKVRPQVVKQESCDDCISRQAAIDELELQAKEMSQWSERYMEQAKGVLTAKNIIKDLPSVTLHPKTEWIPVSERLPKAGEYVGDVDKYYLVQNEYGDMLVARYTHSEYWEQIFRFQPIGDEIVAWMPLPEPYKAESEV